MDVSGARSIKNRRRCLLSSTDLLRCIDRSVEAYVKNREDNQQFTLTEQLIEFVVRMCMRFKHVRPIKLLWKEICMTRPTILSASLLFFVSPRDLDGVVRVSESKAELSRMNSVQATERLLRELYYFHNRLLPPESTEVSRRAVLYTVCPACSKSTETCDTGHATSIVQLLRDDAIGTLILSYFEGDHLTWNGFFDMCRATVERELECKAPPV